MENFDRGNTDELLEIRQYFPPSKFCAIRYLQTFGSIIARHMTVVHILQFTCLPDLTKMIPLCVPLKHPYQWRTSHNSSQQVIKSREN